MSRLDFSRRPRKSISHSSFGEVDEDQRRRTSNASLPTWKAILLSWWPELLSCALSIASTVAMVIVLQNCNNKPLPRWPLGLTLNTLIAFLATVSRSTFMIPVAESVSQAKWLWFQKPRPLRDFETFDEASRGPWGSLKLLVVSKASLSSVLTAIVLVSALLTSTLTQSVITYPSRLATATNPRGISTVPKASHLFGNTSVLQKRMGPRGLDQAMFQGLQFDPVKKLEIDRAACSTSNCRFPEISTLGVCSKYWNVTSALNITRETTSRKGSKKSRTTEITSLPNGAFATWKEGINGVELIQYGAPVGVPGTPLRRTQPLWITLDDFVVGTTSLTNFTVIWHAQGKIGAVDVLLHLCVKRYNVTVQDNISTRDLIDTTHDEEYGPVVVDGTPERNATALKVPGSAERMPFGSDALVETRLLLRGIMNGRNKAGTGPHDTLNRQISATEPYFRGVTLVETGSREGMSIEEIQFEAISNITDNVTFSLSNSLHNSQVLGEALELETFVQVRWPWLAFIASQTFLSIVLVIMTMVKTTGAGIGALKTASLPALFAINTGNRAQLEVGLAPQKPWEEYKAVQRKGKGVMECLTWTEDGWLLYRSEDCSSSEAWDDHVVEQGDHSL